MIFCASVLKIYAHNGDRLALSFDGHGKVNDRSFVDRDYDDHLPFINYK